MKRRTCAATSIALIAAANLVQAQPTAHYPVGVEGVKGASLPPPGVYFRDYNLFYWADRINDNTGDRIGAADPEAFIYANVPRVIWITPVQVLGGYLGVDALIPLQYTSLKANTGGGRFDESTFDAGDLFVEGTWSKHFKQWDVAVGYGIWAPTGDSDDMDPTEPGTGYWGHMFTAGLTFYPDSAKKWSISALSRYEINHEDRDTDITPGNAYTLEWGIGRTIHQNIDIGVVGYYQQQISKDSGHGADDTRDWVASVGPEISTFCPYVGVFTSIRYLYEFAAENRLQGHTVCMTFTKRF